MSFTALTQVAAANAAQRRLPSGRLDLLDGVRGWSALSVVLFHVFWETFGALVPAFRNPIVTPFRITQSSPITASPLITIPPK